MIIDYHDYNSVIVIKIIVFNQDNSKFPDTTVHYTKHVGPLVYSTILE